jgi:S-adenosylmethionine:diacylglycerol 3-amino-3-carboxypropyl transferase
MNTLSISPPAASKRTMLRSEAATRADFSQIRYAQCWEDADVLLDALDIRLARFVFPLVRRATTPCRC